MPRAGPPRFAVAILLLANAPLFAPTEALPAHGWPASAQAVERRVDERVGVRVVRAWHGAYRPPVEPTESAHGVGVQRPQAGVLDLVLALDLPRDQLGVVHDLDLRRAEGA